MWFRRGAIKYRFNHRLARASPADCGRAVPATSARPGGMRGSTRPASWARRGSRASSLVRMVSRQRSSRSSPNRRPAKLQHLRPGPVAPCGPGCKAASSGERRPRCSASTHCGSNVSSTSRKRKISRTNDSGIVVHVLQKADFYAAEVLQVSRHLIGIKAAAQIMPVIVPPFFHAFLLRPQAQPQTIASPAPGVSGEGSRRKHAPLSIAPSA